MKKHKILKYFHHFWTEEKGLTNLLILLCISDFFVFPFFDDKLTIRVIMGVFWMFMLLSGVMTLSKSKLQLYIFSSLPVLQILLSIIRFFHESVFFLYLSFALDVLIYTLLISLVFIKVFEKGPVTTHRIVGAVAVYILIANLWGVIYIFIDLEIPGSFQVINHADGSYPESITFLYFSFTTLTTTGFGDILPIVPLSRTLVILEQLIGVLYPVILLSWLVSQRVEKKAS